MRRGQGCRGVFIAFCGWGVKRLHRPNASRRFLVGFLHRERVVIGACGVCEESMASVSFGFNWWQVKIS